jgi:putative phosphoesterase
VQVLQIRMDWGRHLGQPPQHFQRGPARILFVPLSTIAIISDTHLPRGHHQLPAACVSRLQEADLIIHAGDLITIGILEQLRAFGNVAAVHGNVDDAAVRALLPDRLELTVGDVRVGVVHDAGAAKGRLERLRRSFTKADAVIFGHSHIPLLERAPSSGFQIFNPGSPTDKRRQPSYTMGWAKINGGEIAFNMIELG